MYRTPEQRAATIAGLRDLATYLETHPDVPVSIVAADMSVHVRADTETAKQAEVDRIAGLLDVTPGPSYEGSSHYVAKRTFGPHDSAVVYEVLAIPADTMARHTALMSYQGTVTP